MGHGWRAGFYPRIAAALPEVFECVGIVTRELSTGRGVEERWHVPTFRTVRELAAVGDLDAVVVAVPPPAAPVVIEELAARGIPVLTETPPAPTTDELNRLWTRVGGSGLVMVAEQHPFLPAFVALRGVVSSGVLGDVRSASLSWTHEHHAMALLRSLAGIGGPGTRVLATRASVPLLDGPDRGGRPDRPAVSPRHHTTAMLTDGERLAQYDFTDTQWFNPLRRRQVSVRGSHGEIVGTDVTWAVDGEVVSAPIVRRQLGLDGNLEGTGLATLSWSGRTLYRNPFPTASFSDEELAVATCLLEVTDPRGPRGYSLADGCEDRYLAILVDESSDSRAERVAEPQSWSAALGGGAEERA